MDRTAALAGIAEAQARLREAEDKLAEAARRLQGWCSDRIRDPPNTVMGQIAAALDSDQARLSSEMQFGAAGGSPWGPLMAGAPMVPNSLPWSTPEWGVWWSQFCDHTAVRRFLI